MVRQATALAQFIYGIGLSLILLASEGFQKLTQVVMDCLGLNTDQLSFNIFECLPQSQGILLGPRCPHGRIPFQQSNVS